MHFKHGVVLFGDYNLNLALTLDSYNIHLQLFTFLNIK